MAQNVVIAGATYQSVPAIDVPKSGGGTARFYDEDGTLQIFANDIYDVSGYREANVSVIAPVPTKTITFTINGRYNVSDYGTAIVDVPTVTPTGTITVTKNGTYTVTQYAKCQVNIPVYDGTVSG